MEAHSSLSNNTVRQLLYEKHDWSDVAQLAKDGGARENGYGNATAKMAVQENGYFALASGNDAAATPGCLGMTFDAIAPIFLIRNIGGKRNWRVNIGGKKLRL